MTDGKWYSYNNSRVPGLRDVAPNSDIKCIKPTGEVTFLPDKPLKSGFVRRINTDLPQKGTK